MCKAFEELAEKRALEVRKDAARRMLARGKATVQEIAEDLNLPVEIVEELANLQTA